mmetsp:Transcript_8210/g.14997  ORF Transcript_8210/g.14997 Transcript_8210/m.14997 type:complete len:410 (-) Transcript_8210:993-2222(-)
MGMALLLPMSIVRGGEGRQCESLVPISFELILFHPLMCCFPNVQGNFLRRVRVTNRLGLLTHYVEQLRVLKPARNFKADRLRILTEIPELAVQDDVHISGLLAGQMGRHHYRQSHGGSLGDRARPRLAHEDVCRDHVLRHVRHEPQRHDVDVPWNVRDIVALLSFCGCPVQRELNPPAAVRVLRHHLGPKPRFQRLIRLKALADHGVPASGVEVGFQFFVPSADDADGRVNPLGAQLGVHLVHDVGERSHPLAPSHHEYHSFVGVDIQLFAYFCLVRLTLWCCAIDHGVRLGCEIVPDWQTAHHNFFIWDCAAILRDLLDRFRREIHSVHILIEPSTVARSKICNHSEERNVSLHLLRYRSNRKQRHIIHSGMHRHYHIRIVLLHLLPYHLLVHIIRMRIHKLGIKRTI